MHETSAIKVWWPGQILVLFFPFVVCVVPEITWWPRQYHHAFPNGSRLFFSSGLPRWCRRCNEFNCYTCHRRPSSHSTPPPSPAPRANLHWRHEHPLCISVAFQLVACATALVFSSSLSHFYGRPPHCFFPCVSSRGLKSNLVTTFFLRSSGALFLAAPDGW